MTIKKNWIATLSVLAGLSVLGATASAVAIPGDDATIVIDRALNSPTLTVRYAGAQASMVELKINGTSFGTRAVDAASKKGETTFTIDLSQLADGANEVEVRLFDKTGRVIGTQKSTITADEGGATGPVFMVSPKVGATILGAVDIKVGFGKELRNTYVSFFVNGQFKSMTNTAPYSFTWDTTREENGWHEVEAWVVDDSSATYKTRKVRVFVHNPGGDTRRHFTAPKVEPTPTVNPTKVPATVTPAKVPAVVTPAKAPAAVIPAKAAPTVNATKLPTAVNPTKAATVEPKTAKPNVTPATAVASSVAVAPTLAGTSASNEVAAPIGKSTSLKPIEAKASISMGSRTITPSISKPAVKPVVVAKAAPATVEIKVTSNPKPSAAPIMIERGTRLPVTGTFSISLNSSPVYFDVQPRVQDGVALTPFRALFEQAGGKVDWENLSKAITATGMGQEVFIKIGDKMARVNKINVSLEMAPFIERGRTIVPLSFIREGLNVDVQYDAATGHVLITSKKG